MEKSSYRSLIHNCVCNLINSLSKWTEKYLLDKLFDNKLLKALPTMNICLISVQIEQNAVKFKIAPRKHESIWNIFFSNNQRPPNNLVFQPLSHCHYCLLCGTLNSIIVSGIVPKQNAFKFKIAPHKQKSIVICFDRKMSPHPPPNEALCLSTPKHNGKSGTAS